MSFQYTSGDPSHLVGGTNASMADIQGPFMDLKTFLNARIAAIPTLVSSLPSSPVDGQEIYYLADATSGVVWHLRYRAASGSSSKWEFVGGGALFNEIATAQAAPGSSYSDLTTVGPQITVPVAGDYDITFGTQIDPASSAGASGLASVQFSATAASDTDAVVVTNPASAGMNVYEGRTIRKTVAASFAVTMKYRTGTGATFSRRTMSIRPVRVG